MDHILASLRAVDPDAPSSDAIVTFHHHRLLQRPSSLSLLVILIVPNTSKPEALITRPLIVRAVGRKPQAVRRREDAD
jgi:hypothetical protein